MITERLKVLESLVETFSRVALPVESDSYYAMIKSFREDTANAVLNGDWQALNLILSDVEDEIAALKVITRDRSEEDKFMHYRVVFGERLDIVKDIVSQLRSLSNIDLDVMKVAFKLRGELIEMMMNPEEVKLVRNTVERIDSEAVRLIQYFNDKKQEMQLDKEASND